MELAESANMSSSASIETADVADAPEMPIAKAGGMRSYYRVAEEAGTVVRCDPQDAQIIVFNSPTVEDEADLLEFYNIDYHTLHSSLDPDELSRLEFETDI